MRRVLLIAVIILMCGVVLVGGSVTFVGSNSILKQSKRIKIFTNYKDIKMVIDTIEKKLYLMSSGEVVKSYPIIAENTTSPLSGNWMVVQKLKKSGKNWIGLNIPWGEYGICGNSETTHMEPSKTKGAFEMKDEDIKEVFNLVNYGTNVRVYEGSGSVLGNSTRILSPGSRGADVFEIEGMLKKLGYFNGYADGIYDNNLKDAVNKFQKANDLQISDSLGYDFYNCLQVFLMK